jgi:hypothetical protein
MGLEGVRQGDPTAETRLRSDGPMRGPPGGGLWSSADRQRPRTLASFHGRPRILSIEINSNIYPGIECPGKIACHQRTAP